MNVPEWEALLQKHGGDEQAAEKAAGGRVVLCGSNTYIDTETGEAVVRWDTKEALEACLRNALG